MVQLNNAKQREKTTAAQAAAAGTRLALAAGAGAKGFMSMVQSGGRRGSREPAHQVTGDAASGPIHPTRPRPRPRM